MTELHPDAAALLEDRSDPVPPTYALSVESAREGLADLLGDEPTVDVGATADVSIPGPGGVSTSLPVRIYEPAGATAPYPTTVYLHGGGWTLGGLDTHDAVCTRLAERAGSLVVAVDYRRAPEHPFPAAVEDAYAAVEWVVAHGDRMGADPDRLAVAGDSAGGNLAAVTALLARDRDGPAIARQALLYPVVGAAPLASFPSREENARGYLLESATMDWFRERYLDSAVHLRNPCFAPLLGDLADLPPATVVTAGFDPLRDEGIAYAEKLESAGVPVEHRHYERQIHGFAAVPGRIGPGDAALSAVAGDLADAFDG